MLRRVSLRAVLFVFLSLLILNFSPRSSLAKPVTPPLPLAAAVRLKNLVPFYSSLSEMDRSFPFGPTFNGCGGEQVAVIHGLFEQEVIDLVNQERHLRNLPPLKRVQELDLSARYHAADMAQDNYVEHDTYDRENGTLVKFCNWVERILTYYPFPYVSLGENIAAGFNSPSAVVKAWMNSEGHRQNILNNFFSETGVGYYVKSGGYTAYWVQDFAKSGSRYPLIIERDTVRTFQPEVELFIHGDWEEMRLRNDAGEWTDWQPFRSTLPWTLAKQAGLRTVSVEMHSENKQASSSDTIFLEALAGLVPELHFFYSLIDQQLYPASYSLEPELNESLEFSWQISQEGVLFNVSPLQGSLQQILTVEPGEIGAIQPGVYEESLVLTVMAPDGVINSPYSIRVIMHVNGTSANVLFLPMLTK